MHTCVNMCTCVSYVHVCACVYCVCKCLLVYLLICVCAHLYAHAYVCACMLVHACVCELKAKTRQKESHKHNYVFENVRVKQKGSSRGQESPLQASLSWRTGFIRLFPSRRRAVKTHFLVAFLIHLREKETERNIYEGHSSKTQGY